MEYISNGENVWEKYINLARRGAPSPHHPHFFLPWYLIIMPKLFFSWEIRPYFIPSTKDVACVFICFWLKSHPFWRSADNYWKSHRSLKNTEVHPDNTYGILINFLSVLFFVLLSLLDSLKAIWMYLIIVGCRVGKAMWKMLSWGIRFILWFLEFTLRIMC